ncbi:MAG: NgoFVII family restriction endonuclease, partial [Lachnospiraceae bacterium]
MELLNNYDVKNHKKQLMKMAFSADEMVLASPFLGGDINILLEAINKKEQLKHIVLLTVLKAYDEGINKADTLTAFIEYCEIKNISYEIHIDEKLHGKVYLFYKKKQEKGIIISSSNFTSNGLVKNHEWG